MRRYAALEKVIVPVVNSLDYQFVGLEYVPQGKRSVVRLFIDKPGGVTADDCVRAGRRVNAVLGVEGGLPGDYTLEVSSPGLDRLLFTEEQLQAQIGKRVSVHLQVPIEDRKNFKGTLQTVQGGRVVIEVDGQDVTFSFTDIDRARLVPEW